MDSFVGREIEVAVVKDLLSRFPVVTLTGAPGVGKSSLARRIAAELGCSSIVLLAESDPAGASAAVENAVASGVPELLVLDDCDDVLSACGGVVAEIGASVSGAPRVIVTSRQPLGLGPDVERAWRVPSLAVPDALEEGSTELLASVEAANLFCQRAAAADPRFRLTAANAATVADICRRLDGIPLAIELAAGRLATMALDQVAAALDDVFGILVDDSARRPERHRSLRAAIQPSADRLSDPEQRLWRRLSVFASTFGSDAAAEVCWDDELSAARVSDLLGGLTTRSLLVAEVSPGTTRFYMLDCVRRLAWEALESAGEVEHLAARHAAWCVSAVMSAGDPRQGRAWVERLVPDAENLEAALGWAAASDRAEEVGCLGAAHMILCHAMGRQEDARDWLGPVVGLAMNAAESSRAMVLRQAGLAAGLIGEFAHSFATLDQSAIAARSTGDRAGMIQALSLVGFVAMLACDYARGLAALDETVTVARTTDDDDELLRALAAAGRAQVLVGDPTIGRQRFEEALEVARRAGDEPAAANALVGVGWSAVAEGNQARAHCALTEGLALARSLSEGAATSTALALVWLGELSLLRHDDPEARSRFEEAATVARRAGAPYALGRSLLGLGRLALASGDMDEARRRFEESLDVAHTTNLPFLVGPSLRGLGEAAAVAGHSAESRALLEEAAAVAGDCGDRAEEAACLAILADL